MQTTKRTGGWGKFHTMRIKASYSMGSSLLYFSCLNCDAILFYNAHTPPLMLHNPTSSYSVHLSLVWNPRLHTPFRPQLLRCFPKLSTAILFGRVNSETIFLLSLYHLYFCLWDSTALLLLLYKIMFVTLVYWCLHRLSSCSSMKYS